MQLLQQLIEQQTIATEITDTTNYYNKDIIFSAECRKTSSNFFKTLVELVSQISSVSNREGVKKSIKQICLKITKSGVEIFSDSMKVVTSSAVLDKSFFNDYYFHDEDALCIGISLDIIKSCFKYVHKNDSIKISISQNIYNIFPDTIHFTLNESKGFSIKFNIVQNIDNSNYDDYNLVISIPSNRLSNLYKEIGGIKKQVQISQKENNIKLSSTMVNIAENWVSFPMVEKCNFELLKTSEIVVKSEYFKISSKISTFDKFVDIYFNSEGNILLKSQIKNSKSSDNITGIVFINIVELKLNDK